VRHTKGAVKLHLMLDHGGLLPCYGVITDGKQHEVTVVRQWEFAPGTILVFDRGYQPVVKVAQVRKPSLSG
jgi:hypothetical protein